MPIGQTTIGALHSKTGCVARSFKLGYFHQRIRNRGIDDSKPGFTCAYIEAISDRHGGD